MKLNIFVFILLFSFPVDFCFAGKDNFFFTRLDVENGLSQQTVTTIFQDADGYMWFGTRNGLNRYDGYGFKVYRKDYDDSFSLSGNYIMTIAQDRDRDIWVGTQQGLNRIDYETEKINRYRLDSVDGVNSYINSLFITADNRILACTKKNMYIYDACLDSFRLYDSFTHRVSSVAEDVNHQLYFGTYNDGLYIYSADFKLIRHVTNQNGNSHALPAGDVSFLLADSSGYLWIVTDNSILSRYNIQEEKLTYLPEVKNVRQLIDWNENELLIATFQGLVLLDKKTLQVTPLHMNIGAQGALSHYSVLCLYKDTWQNLWVGTYSGGINYYNKYNYRFHYIQPREFNGIIGMGSEDQNGGLWFATEGGGLLSYDPKTEKQQRYLIHTAEGRLYNKNIIKSILIEGDQILCATHGGEVYLFSIPNRTFHLLYNYGYNDIYCLYRDSSDRLWIPTNTKEGLVVMDGKERVEMLNLRKRYGGLSPITVIMEMDRDRFLVGTIQDGIWMVNGKSGEATAVSAEKFGFQEDEKLWITAIRKERDGNFWVATNGAGLFLFDRDMNLIKRYSKQNGLPDERVYSLLGDEGEYLWVMTSCEFYRLNKTSGELTRFYSRSGVVPQEFSTSSGVLTANGKLYFPGSKGILSVDPGLLRKNQDIPPVLLTSLRINNQLVEANDEKSILSRKLQLQEKLVLKYNQTNLIIGYTALNYIYPEQCCYAYRLQGVDKGWNQVEGRREAFYSNLKPGEYQFQVMASNSDGIWNETGATLDIIVLAPLWFRWWAFVIYVLVVIFVVCQIVFYRHRKHELERSLHLQQLEQEKLEELNQERVRFFTHVAHEFRTPLTLIINPLDELLQKYVHITGVKDSLLLIRKNTQRLLSLVNSLMDIQKYEKEGASFHFTAFDFGDFVREINLSFHTMADSRGVVFNTIVEPAVIPVYYDREKLEQVFFNLLSNAFKFTPVGGHVEVRVVLSSWDELQQFYDGKIPGVTGEISSRWLSIRVCDTGIGLNEQDKERIFEPFYQSGIDLHGQIAGSGIGLSLSKSIIEQHGGVIFPREMQPSGLEMCVLLPYRFDSEMVVESNYLLEESERQEIVGCNKNDLTEFHPEINHTDYKLLLVEDNREVLEYLEKQFKNEYHILTAVNGKEALKLIEKELPDMVVSDVMMPEMDGVELCRRIKQDIRLCHIPVILLTARSMTMHIEEGFSAGADDYIAKPFSVSLLRIRIRNIFVNRGQMKEIFGKKYSLAGLGINVESVDEAFMNRYVEIVRKNFTNSKLDVDMICQELGMSRANFYKKLKTVTDLSPADMIRNIRLESAARLLQETKLTVSEVAVQVGFNSNSYFGSCFKALYGVSPKEYQTTRGGTGV